MKSSYVRCYDSGVTLIEVTVVMLLAALITGTAVLNLREFNNPLINATAQLAGFVKQIRAEAISSTSAYIIRPATATRLVTAQGVSCADPDPAPDPMRVLDLEDGARLVDIEWDICINSRGFPDANLEIPVRDANGAMRTVEILLGGAVRIQ